MSIWLRNSRENNKVAGKRTWGVSILGRYWEVGYNSKNKK